MNNIEEMQISQTINIIDTLIEASEHFLNLVKQGELNQSIFIFSSIVDGLTAINNVNINSPSLDGNIDKERIDNTVLLIANELQEKKLTKITEILQFNFIPQLRRFKKGIEGENPIIKQEINIGVYLSYTNPRKVYPEARLNALVEEADRQGAKILIFSSSDVNFELKQIDGEINENGIWKKVSKPFPDVIHNIGITSRILQSKTERKLRRLIPFTSFGVGNKFYLPKKLVENRKFAELLAPFKVVTDENILLEFLKENQKGVLKPIVGRQGLNIYFIEKKGNHFIIHDDKKERIFGIEKFKDWIKEKTLTVNNSYIIQNYIDARTNKGEPFDIRAHMQKNKEGKWEITKIYPRIGKKQSILSNISRGGRTEDLKDFLTDEYKDKGKTYLEDLKELSLELTQHLDKLYGLALDELGLDLAIDRKGRFWLHEVNNGPQSTYHEKERAVNTIGYAIYVAKNGLFFTNEFQKQNYPKGQFNARKTDLLRANVNEKVSIGMLVMENEINNLAIACAYVAKYENVNFFYFTPLDIDYEEMLIRGSFYENNEWVTKVVNYPDVIYDRLRARGIEGFKMIYEELEGIPFTNELYGDSISKLKVYDQLSSTGLLNDIIIPYEKVTRLKTITQYIESYGSIILKPEVGSFAQGVRFIKKISIDNYLVAEGENINYLNELSLSKYLRNIINKGTYIVQKYIETRTKENNPFDIRVHLMKDGNGDWSFVNNYPRIGTNYATITSTGNGGYIGGIQGFLSRNFSEEKANHLKIKIEEKALSIARIFESSFESELSELGIDLAIDKNLNIFLIEVNVNKPGIVYYEFEVAKHAIPYAIYLYKNKKLLNKSDTEITLQS